jgi:hypothetical protein
MNFHVLQKKLSLGRLHEKRRNLSLNYDLQKCFKVVSKIGYTG